MRASTTLLACSALGFGLAMAQEGEFVDAPETLNNPKGVVFSAVLYDKKDTTVRGWINATAGPGGRGVNFDIDFWGFPDEDEFGPFPYHIHVEPVPGDGNCTATLAHLDPFARGEKPPCDPTAPATCQVGDLSGKHGYIKDVKNGKHFRAQYHDAYVTTFAGPGAFFGNRSVVVHYKNATRINCGNFRMIESPPFFPTTPNPTDDPPAPTGSSTPTGPHNNPSGSPKPTGSNVPNPPPPSAGGASRIGAVSVGVILATIAALML
ncbi:hypothetical protein GX51_08062 [Blastomyces parvus]|uniref:superoxide dismutase n=1 Tax=Blastomyces parvus TaxID=2060905 RepID=A0A2B7WH91_9EURO|nr:hypothetical protein GX51_08062 [Blastomyces parvus]